MRESKIQIVLTHGSDYQPRSLNSDAQSNEKPVNRPVITINCLFLTSLTLLLFILCVDLASAEISGRNSSSEKLQQKLYKTTYKDVPFEPLTERRRSKDHSGDKWLDFTFKPNDTLPSLIRNNDLDDRTDRVLQSGLESTIKHLGLMEQINRKKLSVALVDITDNDNPRLAMLNGNEMMYAASLPKIAILLGAFVDIEQGQMTLDKKTRESLTRMIRFSSNGSATEMLHRVGKNHLQKILTSDRYRFYDRSKNGGLWVGKEYGKNPAFQRDPLHNLSHGATAFQAARFYYLLETEQLVSPKLCKEMKEILSKPKINHKFVKGLENHPEAKIYRKSGSWRQWHSDSALVEANGYKYIAIALSENPEGGKWLADMISPLHNLIVPQAFAGLN